MLKDLDTSLEGRHVIIVEDIVDTGLTLTYLQDILRARAPKTLKTACLLSKPSRRKVDVDGRIHRLYDRGQVRRRLRPRLRREVSQPRAHRGAGRGMKRFDIITEADARMLDVGSTRRAGSRWAGDAAGAATRSAARRVTVVAAGTPRMRTLPADLAPVADVRRVAIGSDHSGVALKKALVQHLRGRGLAVTDVGTDGTEPVDYPDIAAAVGAARWRARKPTPASSSTAPGLARPSRPTRSAAFAPRCAWTKRSARYSREHNGANVLDARRDARAIGLTPRMRIVDIWLGTPMREARYIRRLLKIRRLEERSLG